MQSNKATKLNKLKHQDFDSTMGYPGEGPELRILSTNIQGAQTKTEKYHRLIDYANDQANKYDIICIQETHSDQNNRIKQVLAASHPNIKVWEAINLANTRKGGVAIIVTNPNIKARLIEVDNTNINNWTQRMTPPELEAIEEDSIIGKWLTIQFKWCSQTIHLTNIYAPTLSSKTGQLTNPSYIARRHFFNYLGNKLESYENNIVAGDFNNVPQPLVDKIWITTPSNRPPEDMTEFNDNFVHKLHLIDTYMNSYDEESGPVAMTHKSSANTSYSRIDRIYHSGSLNDYTWIHHSTNRSTDTNPLPFQTDHYPVSISLIDPNDLQVKQYKSWKLNVSTMLIKENLLKLNQILESYYNKTNEDNVFEQYEEFKNQTIEYMRLKQRNDHTANIKVKERLNNILEPNSGYSDKEIEAAKQLLSDKASYELEGKRIRSKALQVSQKSKMTKYHFRLAKKQHEMTVMNQMLDPEDNNLKTKQEDIERILCSYWAHIMRKRNTNCLPAPRTSRETVTDSITRTMPDYAKELLGQNTDPSNFEDLSDQRLLQFIHVSTQDIFNSIKSSKLNKAPGIDGLPIEFYEILATNPNSTIILFLQKVYNKAYKIGYLPPSMRKSQIRLLFKKEAVEDKKYPKNYRPIALLSVDYKILSKLLATKLSPHLKLVIDDTQFCQPGKEIGELILYYQSLIDDTTKSNQPGALAFLDFEKAFDSVDHEFTFAMLHAVGIPNEFIKWTKLAFTNTQACVIVNGKKSAFFDLPGGGRQGDNLYPMIFAIVVQGLASLIATYDIQGIVDQSRRAFTIGQYADDTTLGVGCDDDWIKYDHAISIFCDASGMMMNWDKSLALWLGANITTPPKIPPASVPTGLTFLRDGLTTRMLGARVGTNTDKNTLWNYLQPKLSALLNSKLNKSGDELGNTLIANCIITGSIIFNARLQYLSTKHIRMVSMWSTFFY